MAAEDGEPAKARAALEKVLQLDKSSAIALRQLGRLELTSGDYAKSAGYLRRVRDAHPNDAARCARIRTGAGVGRRSGGGRDALLASFEVEPKPI